VQSPTTISRVTRQTSTEPRLTIHGHLVTSDRRRLIYCRLMFLTILRAQYWKSIQEKVAQCGPLGLGDGLPRALHSDVVGPAGSLFPRRDPGMVLAPHDQISILINFISAHEECCQHEIHEFLDDEEQSLLSKRHSARQSSGAGDDNIWQQQVFHEVEVVIDESKANCTWERARGGWWSSRRGREEEGGKTKS
jgi:hypothetical protein